MANLMLGLGRVWEELSIGLLARCVFADNCVAVGILAVRVPRNADGVKSCGVGWARSRECGTVSSCHRVWVHSLDAHAGNEAQLPSGLGGGPLPARHDAAPAPVDHVLSERLPSPGSLFPDERMALPRVGKTVDFTDDA